LKTYKHGDKFNIIFPRAKADLKHYLRDKNPDCEDLRAGPLEQCAIWRQALGITRALGSISKIDATSAYESDPHTKTPLNGFHFDLKPANILVNSDNTFLITDFGIARFTNANESNSRVMSLPGTDAYAPPENLNVTEKLSRKYDVWSLGCILLEITAFTVGGQRNLLNLDKARHTTRGNRTDHRFFQERPNTNNEFELKPGVVQFKDSLLQAEKSRPISSRDFLRQLLDLIEKMLDPVAESRLDIHSVMSTLAKIIEIDGHQPMTPAVLYPIPMPIGEEYETTDRLRKLR